MVKGTASPAERCDLSGVKLKNVHGFFFKFVLIYAKGAVKICGSLWLVMKEKSANFALNLQYTSQSEKHELRNRYCEIEIIPYYYYYYKKNFEWQSTEGRLKN